MAHSTSKKSTGHDPRVAARSAGLALWSRSHVDMDGEIAPAGYEFVAYLLVGDHPGDVPWRKLVAFGEPIFAGATEVPFFVASAQGATVRSSEPEDPVPLTQRPKAWGTW